MKTWKFTWTLFLVTGFFTSRSYAQVAGDTLLAYNICFPADTTIERCGSIPPANLFTQALGDCDVLGISWNDVTYRLGGNTCSRIFRTFMVVDWCAYNDDCGPQSAQMFVVNRDAPDSDGILGEGVCVLVRDDDENGYPEVYFSSDLVPSPTERITIPTPCARNSHPIWSYTQILTVTDTERPVVQGLSAGPFASDPQTCKGAAVMRFQVSDNCSGPLSLQTLGIATTPGGALLAPTVFSPSWTQAAKLVALGAGMYQVVLDGLPLGSYELGVTFRDECGNVSLNTRMPFEIRDNSVAAPICYHGLSASLMSDGTDAGILTLPASMFVARPVYDCSGQGPETNPGNPQQKRVTAISINRWGEPADRNQTSLTFTCSDALNYIPIQIHAWDEQQNHSYCETYIEIQDNGFVCPTPEAVSIAGKVQTESNLPLPAVEIHMSGDSLQMVKTNDKGVFRIAKLQKGRDYRVTPSYDKDVLKGINGRDLLLLQQHLLGIPVLKSPYKLIAADVDRSGSVNMTDLKILQAVFLKKLDKFPGNTSWRFLDLRQQVSNAPNSTFPIFQESSLLKGFANQDTALNYLAIKVGDLDGSGFTAPLQGSVELEAVGNPVFKQGTRVTVPIYLSAASVVPDGIVGKLVLDPKHVRLLDIQAGTLSSTDYSWNVETGAVEFASVAVMNPSEPLFTLVLESDTEGVIDEILKLSETGEATAIRDATPLDVQLRFRTGSTQPVPDNRVMPNPFREVLHIQVEVPFAGEAALMIHDMQGRLVFQGTRRFEVGSQAWAIPGSLFPTGGFYTYTLRSDWGMISGKVLKVE